MAHQPKDWATPDQRRVLDGLIKSRDFMAVRAKGKEFREQNRTPEQIARRESFIKPPTFKELNKFISRTKADVRAKITKEVKKVFHDIDEADASGSDCFSDVYYDYDTKTATCVFRRDGYTLDIPMTRGEWKEFRDSAPDLGEFYNDEIA